MTARRVHFDTPGDLFGPEPREQRFCAVCGGLASFGYGPPGWPGLRRDRQWFCAEHRPDFSTSQNENAA